MFSGTRYETYINKENILPAFAGIVCFLFSPYGITIDFQVTYIDVPWAVLLPIFISMAYGVRAAFITGFFGGAFYPFLLWTNNGWANVLNSLLLLLLFVLVGWAYRSKIYEVPRIFFSRFIITLILFFVVMSFSYRYLFNFMLSFNPPFWNSVAVTKFPVSLLTSFILKDIINFSFLIILVDAFLRISSVRAFLGLLNPDRIKSNGAILIVAIISTLFIWLIFVTLNYALFANENPYAETYNRIALIVILLSGVITASVIFRYVENRHETLELLTIANEKAIEMNRVKSLFFANMSHELRTPFVGILGYANLLSEIVEKEDEKELADGILRTSHRLMDTLTKILNVTKMEFDHYEAEFDHVSINQLIEEVYEQFYTATQLKKIKLTKTFLCEDSVVYTDSRLLIDILNNLINNAIKFTNEGEVEIITFINRIGKQDFFNIIVRDTGIGIAKDKQEIIWQEFRQASEGTNREYQGTGLGLSIIKKYTELLGGSIHLESELGSGSKFTLILPMIDK
ncbi:MAG: ATP-binding protein [Melioribacteraceae bacterium]|nr:ATP-binding protein [Melioribacteraceae bacterium]